ncbi:MAG: hypothetical protein K2P78_05420 [Gemmataceae bacterium]|nr:hypothetical protein [Gemmataceae bacterium]
MAAKGGSQNGHHRLEEAMAILINTQATLTAQLGENARRHLEYERATSERVDRIEAQMKEFVRILTEHNRRLEQLTEAVRDRIGFKG